MKDQIEQHRILQSQRLWHRKSSKSLLSYRLHLRNLCLAETRSSSIARLSSRNRRGLRSFYIFDDARSPALPQMHPNPRAVNAKERGPAAMPAGARLDVTAGHGQRQTTPQRLSGHAPPECQPWEVEAQQPRSYKYSIFARTHKAVLWPDVNIRK
jgi:hypothetical protein